MTEEATGVFSTPPLGSSLTPQQQADAELARYWRQRAAERAMTDAIWAWLRVEHRPSAQALGLAIAKIAGELDGGAR